MSNYEAFCKDLVSTFQETLTWKWDPRFNAVLTEFSAETKDQVRKVLDRYLSYTWDSTILENAPGSAQAVSNQLGGLMSGQLLFTSDPDNYPITFCAWWPWGDGNTISIRVADTDPNLGDDEKSKRINQAKNWFGLS